jgi:hypothetical protein
MAARNYSARALSNIQLLIKIVLFFTNPLTPGYRLERDQGGSTDTRANRRNRQSVRMMYKHPIITRTKDDAIWSNEH